MESNTLDDLIKKGEDIYNNLSCYYGTYSFGDCAQYGIWSKTVIRYLCNNYKGDRCINDFEELTNEIAKSGVDKVLFSQLVGVLHACNKIPDMIEQSPLKNSLVPISLTNNINQTQSQDQTQEQNLAINIFIESIKDELTGKQQKEIKEIIGNEPNPTQARTKILDKIKSFGSDVISNIVANIITNPAIWGSF